MLALVDKSFQVPTTVKNHDNNQAKSSVKANFIRLPINTRVIVYLNLFTRSLLSQSE